MKGKKCVVLMTACINPPATNFKKKNLIHRRDPLLRLNDYLNSFSYWLTYYEPLIEGIVFIENSGYELAQLKELAAVKNIYNREIDFLQQTAGEKPKGLHYGYSELEMIDRAFEKSKLINASDYVIKVTGRLFFPNLSRLINFVPDNCAFLADCRDFKFFNSGQHYIVTNVFVVQKDFYLKNLFDVKSRMVLLKSGHIETLYYKILKPLHVKQPKNVVLRFPFNVDPVGVGAHWNISYSSYKKKLPSFLRGICRQIIPNLWI